MQLATGPIIPKVQNDMNWNQTVIELSRLQKEDDRFCVSYSMHALVIYCVRYSKHVSL